MLPNSALSYPVPALVDLKLEKICDGLLYLADASRNLQFLHSHQHIKLEVNLAVQGTIIYVVDGLRFSFSPRTLLWLFPEQEHQLVDRLANAQSYVLVLKQALIARSFRAAAYRALERKSYEKGGVLSTLLKPDAFDLLSKTMHLMIEESLGPDLLNREAGYGESSTFRFQHNDPDALNVGLH